MFRNLQDVHSFAPLQSQQFGKKSSIVPMSFIANVAKLGFLTGFEIFRSDFDEIISEFNEFLRSSALLSKFSGM